MGKNHRHKKDLRAEKAKVKLKQSAKTKFLPKGQNVTNTTFKIKPIVLPEQLKQKDSGTALSKRKLNANDLISRLKHYNENVRHDACDELTEMVKIHTEEIIEQHLAQVTLALSCLMQDREVKVRKSAVKAVNTILISIPEDKLRPFFNYFSTNLRCAMTNINKNIQEDSLLFLDCFLTNNSKLISEVAENLLPDFFTLISKFRSDSQLDRTLTVNLNSKLTSVIWRIKVLSRLHAILKLVLNYEYGNSDKTALNDKCKDASATNTFPIYNSQFQTSVNYNSFNVFQQNKNSFNNASSVGIINRHIVVLIPLLYETWLEVVPPKTNLQSENTILTEEAAVMLTCITNTLYLLYLFVNKFSDNEINIKSIFLNNDGRKFLNHLLKNFPYTQTGIRKKKEEKQNKSLQILNTSNIDPKCVQENLLVCFLYASIFVNNSNTNIKSEMSQISLYINKTLLTMNDSNMNCLIEILKACLGKNSKNWNKFGFDVNSVLKNAIFLYDNGKISETSKLDLFKVLSDIIENNSLNCLEIYKNWLSSLPHLLCEPKITDTVVFSLLELSIKNDDTFHLSLKKRITSIIENLNAIKFEITQEGVDEEELKRYLVNILFYAPRFSQKDFKVIQKFISRNQNDSFAVYLNQMKDLRKWLKNENWS